MEKDATKVYAAVYRIMEIEEEYIYVADISISLIRKCKGQDREAFSLLLSRYEGYLYRLCFNYLRNQEDTLDVIQEVFIKVFRSIDTFDESRDFLPWLRRITVNACLNYLRNKNRKFHLSLDFEKEDQWSLNTAKSESEDVAEKVVRLTTDAAIRDCLDLLPPGPRMILTLRYVENMSCQEIADVLEQPLGTVKSSLFRARAQLKKVLEQNGLLEV